MEGGSMAPPPNLLNLKKAQPLQGKFFQKKVGFNSCKAAADLEL